jgi:hypothetical protein
MLKIIYKIIHKWFTPAPRIHLYDMQFNLHLPLPKGIKPPRKPCPHCGR